MPQRTVQNQWGVECPKCKGTDLRADLMVTVKLLPEGYTNISVDDVLEKDSYIYCCECDHDGTVKEFATTDSLKEQSTGVYQGDGGPNNHV